MVAAGYCLYSATTVLVLTLGSGVHGFTLDPDRQIFLQTHPNMRVPDVGAGAVEHPSAVPDDVLLDPEGNTPLRIFEVAAAQVPLVCEGWTPPLRLTEREREIVEATGLTSVLGRSVSSFAFLGVLKSIRLE